VATGAAAMPLKLPAPDFGTDEQAGPKSIAAAAPDPAAAGAAADPPDAGADPAEAADEEDPLELHAAVPSARLTARPDTARRRCFMSLLLI